MYFSEREASRLRTHIDQTPNKDVLDYNLHERQKNGKSRTPKSKHRQSPYTNSCETREFATDFETEFKNGFDIGVPLQSFQGIQYSPSIITNAHAQDSILERYQALYSPYGSPHPVNSLKACAYSCAPPPQPHFDSGQFRISCEERFTGPDSGYIQLNPAAQNDPKLDETIQLVPVTREIRASGRCSRSSSRGEAFVPALPLHETPSNRSESSASEVDVISEDLETGKSDNKHCSKVYKDRLNMPNEPVQQSVIMRMPNQNHTMCQSPRYSCDYSKSNMTKSPRTSHAEVDKYPAEPGNSPNANYMVDEENEKLYDGIKHLRSKTLSDEQIMQCLKSNYQYEPYNGGTTFPTSGIQERPYPVVQQREYTSVIVDPQRYQSGFVH